MQTMPYPRQIQVSISYICPALNLPLKFFHYYIYCSLTRHCWCRIITKLLWHFFYDTYVLCKYSVNKHSLLNGQHFWPSLFFTIQHTNQGRHISAQMTQFMTYSLWLGSYFPVFREMITDTLYFNKRAKVKETPACKNATFSWHMNLL